jgi:Xaa-Pro aminopeptidase
MRVTDSAEHVVNDRRLVELNCSRLRELMRADGVDAVFVISLDSWRYVTGLPIIHSVFATTVNAAVVCADSAFPTLFPLKGFGRQMQLRAPWFQDIEELPMESTREGMQPMGIGRWPEIIAAKLRNLGLSTSKIAIDSAMPFSIKEELQKRLQTARFVDGGKILHQARIIKNEEELKALRSACILADVAMGDALEVVKAGASELDIAAAAEHSFRVHGAEYSAFTPQVFTGMHSLIPYNNPSFKTVRDGELVRIDIGCCSHGYHSCFGRTVLVGTADNEVKDAFNAVHHALSAGIAAARPGITNVQLHGIMADALAKHSGGKYALGPYGGHGIGAGIHEDPMIGDKDSVVEIMLETNMSIALEPSIMVPERGWLGMEDNLIITASGCEVITRTRFGLEHSG